MMRKAMARFARLRVKVAIGFLFLFSLLKLCNMGFQKGLSTFAHRYWLCQ